MPVSDTAANYSIGLEPRLTAHDIDAAAARLAGIISGTPLQRCDRLSELSGAEVYLKREDLQAVRSYKLRGAFNLMTQLTESERQAGVVTASAGNHAQGVAFACRQLGIMGRIYVPRTTPHQKRDRIRVHGGSMVELVMVGETFDEAANAAAEEVAATGARMVHPFNDLRTIAGQGTIAREIVNQLGRVPDTVVVPVGGGGLLAGTATFYAERFPNITVIGVEPAGAASMTAALRAGHPVSLEQLDPFVDGAAVRQVGDLTHALIAAAGSRVVTVEEGAICTAMLGLYQSEGIITEPAGAITAASLGTRHDPGVLQFAPGSTVVLVVSGGNNDVSRYNEILERSLVHEGLKHYFLVNFPQEPGALRKFLHEVLGPDDDIVLFEYVKRNNRETGPALVGIEIGSPDDLPSLLKRMQSGKMQIEQLDPNSPSFRFLT